MSASPSVPQTRAICLGERFNASKKTQITAPLIPNSSYFEYISWRWVGSAREGKFPVLCVLAATSASAGWHGLKHGQRDAGYRSDDAKRQTGFVLRMLSVSAEVNFIHQCEFFIG
jgi:hypothetical protein